MRYLLVVLSMLMLPAASARTEVGVAIGVPGISIGINVPAYPRLVRVPGYPVYYDPGLSINLFFYDGLYWLLQGDSWYVSSWYNGPWDWADPYDVPVYVLRIPVRYYRAPPPYFRGWRVDAPPRWSDHWGRDWQSRRSDWDRRDNRPPPPPAPLPSYQRNYSGDRYPKAQEQQRSIRSERYQYAPREPVTQRHYEGQREQREQRGQRDHDGSQGRGPDHR